MNTNAQLRLQPTPSAQYATIPMASQPIDQPQRAIVAASQNVNQIETYTPEINAISTIATSSTEATAIDPLSCNYRNCSVPATPSNHIKATRKPEPATAFQAPQSNRSHKTTDANLALIRNQSNQTILPPPLFDESATISTATLPLLPNDSVRQMKRRHHRTIPRHFTLTDPKAKYADDSTKLSASCSMSSGSATLNKKSICQCPVPHIPMTYMGSAHLNLSRNQQSSEILMSTLSRKWSHHKSNVSKSASFTSNISSTATGYNRNSASGLLSATNPLPSAQSRAAASGSSNTNTNQTKPAKITTISKQIGNNELNGLMQPQAKPTANEVNDAKSMQELLPISIVQSKAGDGASEGSSATKSIIVERMDPTVNLINPALPPKTTKSQAISRPASIASAMSKSYTAGSTMSTNAMQMPVPAAFKSSQRSSRDRSKSPLTDKTYSLVTPLASGPEQKSAHIKTTYPTTSNLTIAGQHMTLPKPVTRKPAPNPKPSSSIVNNNTNAPVLISSISTNKHHGNKSKPITFASNANESNTNTASGGTIDNRAYMQLAHKLDNDKALPVCTTVKNCSNPKEHFLPNDASLDDDYLSECENCKSAHGSRYYLDKEHEEQPHETMTLQRKMDERENDEQTYYRTSSTLPTNTKQKTK